MIGALLYAMRPWSWTASLISVLISHSLTASGSFFTPVLLRYILIGVSIQCVGNLVNTYFDFKLGCDTKKMKGGDRALVDGTIPAATILPTALALTALATWLSLPIFETAEFSKNIFGVGMLLTYGYTCPPFKLKYRALGDVVIVTCFGPLLMQFIAIANTAAMSETVFLFSVPISLITELILHANNTRDIKSDTSVGATTLASILGKKNSILLYKVVLLAAYAVIVFLIRQTGNYGLAIVFASVPQAVSLVAKVESSDDRIFSNCDEFTAQFHLPFGLLTVVGIAIGKMYF